MIRARATLITTCILAFAAAPAGAALLLVPDMYPTIELALVTAQPGDEVRVACGVYREHDLVMRDGVTLVSETGGSTCATIDAQGLGRAMTCTGLGAGAVIRGFSFENGLAPDGEDGGAVLCDNASPIFEACSFTGNATVNGDGGGVAAVGGSAPYFVRCRFGWNSAGGAGRGGGLFLSGSPARLLSSSLVGNDAAGDGGGLFGQGSAATLTECEISENDCGGDGGGLCLRANSPVVGILLLIHGNAADGTGGGLCVEDGAPLILSSTLAENSALVDGSGVFSAGTAVVTMDRVIVAGGSISPAAGAAGGAVNLSCSDVHGNAGGDWTGPIAAQGTLNGNLSANPEFCGDPGSGNFFLQADSPCAPANNACGTLLGARIVDCGYITTETTSWSVVKSIY